MFIVPKRSYILVRCAKLWAELQEWYRENRVEDKFDNMYESMIKQDKKSPKLRGKAAEIRGVVPFGEVLATRKLSAADPFESTVREAAILLHRMYQQLSSHQVYAADVLAESCRKFCGLYVAMSDVADPLEVETKVAFDAGTLRNGHRH